MMAARMLCQSRPDISRKGEGMKRTLQLCLALFALPLFAAGPKGPQLIHSGRPIPNAYIVVFESRLPDVAAAADEIGRAHGAQVTHLYNVAIKGFAARMNAHAAAAIAN